MTKATSNTRVNQLSELNRPETVVTLKLHRPEMTYSLFRMNDRCSADNEPSSQ